MDPIDHEQPEPHATGEDPVDWRLDRAGTIVWWSGPQLDAMSVLIEPTSGASLCEGRVSVRLDGSWRCTRHCSGPPSTFHRASAVADCSEPQSGCCLCWECLEGQVAYRFSIYGDYEQEWKLLLARVGQAPADARAEFVSRCTARSSLRPDASSVFAGVERWLFIDGMWGLVDRYSSQLVPGTPMWAYERAVCAAAALLESDVAATLGDGADPASEQLCDDLVADTFDSLWADLLESCGYPREIAPVAIALAPGPLSLYDLLEAAARAAS